MKRLLLLLLLYSPVRAQETFVYVRVLIHDALQIGEVLNPASQPITLFLKLPPDSVEGDQISPETRQRLLAKLYGGPNWQSGNEDGSCYVLLSLQSRRINAEEWKQPVTWRYQIDEHGQLVKAP